MTSRRTQIQQAAPTLEGNEHWDTQAACKDMDTNDFYVPSDDDRAWGRASHIARIPELRAICRACPVRDLCIDDAIRTDDRHGFRGGLTPPERLRLARKAKSA